MKTKRTPLVCAFGTNWTDHFPPPIGNGLGCVFCASYEGNEPTKKPKERRKP